uniref:Ubiquinone biosynthesis methyltransferase COQ5 n=1 Tax=Macrostomum lignano TaxID=282301 RepID=A0A1I8F492_9PLAT
SSLKCNAVSFSAASAAARQPAAAAALVSPAVKSISQAASTLRSVSKKLNRARSRTESTRCFNRVSNSYDVMNDLMSAGLHRCWKRRFVASANPRPGWRVVDVAGGTGDIALGLLEWSRKLLEGRHLLPQENVKQPLPKRKRRPVAQLAVRKLRAKGSTFASSIQWLEGRAESLPHWTRPLAILYTIAFGMRNCTDLGVLREAHRVLKPYGRSARLKILYCRSCYDEYSFRVIPPMGLLVAGDWDSYEYLVESIRRFPHQTLFANMMREAGFSAVNYEVLWP